MHLKKTVLALYDSTNEVEKSKITNARYLLTVSSSSEQKVSKQNPFGGQYTFGKTPVNISAFSPAIDNWSQYLQE